MIIKEDYYLKENIKIKKDGKENLKIIMKINQYLKEIILMVIYGMEKENFLILKVLYNLKENIKMD